MQTSDFRLIQVALPIPLRQTFDYKIALHLPNTLLGRRVKVPFGPTKTMIGIVVGESQDTAYDIEKIKFILSLIDHESLFTHRLFQLLHWAARYYQTSLGEVLFQALPTPLRQGKPLTADMQPFYQLTTSGCNQLPLLAKNAVKQRQILTLLQQSKLGLERNQLIQKTSDQAVLKALQDKGWITLTHKPFEYAKAIAKMPDGFTLNAQQSTVIQQVIAQQGFNAFLLYGITGSGKTEVYLQLMAHYLAQDKQVLILIPEIGLTPQTLQRFEDRFQTKILVMHSNLSDGERYRTWYSAKTNTAQILIGTRSALFAPFENLGLIIVDEEHDASFKQQDTFHYNGRDLAVRRAQMENIPIVLGSATPSLESLYNVQQQRYQLLRLTSRAGVATTAQYHLIDLKQQIVKDGLSTPLINAMRQTLARGQQVLLFLNRRGYAPSLFCRSCGHVATCKRCDMKFTLHSQQRKLHCHHCDSQKPIPFQCEQCGSTELMPVGLGTERIEETLNTLFAQTPILRIDKDTTARKGAMDQFLTQIHQGTPQILIGTQMLAKGHHFPNVTLVAMIDADRGLLSSDFRAHERFAQLFLQVAGRAGRADKQGQVIIQTYQPEHPLLKQLITKDYLVVANHLLEERQQTEFPPYAYLVLFHAQASQAETMFAFLSEIAQLTLTLDNIIALGPLPAPIAKKAGQYRGQLLLQTTDRRYLQQQLSSLVSQIEKLPQAKRVRWRLDVDPLDIY